MCAPDSNFDVKTSHSLSMEVCGESSPPEFNASEKKINILGKISSKMNCMYINGNSYDLIFEIFFYNEDN